jgi:hypothetical protein
MPITPFQFEEMRRRLEKQPNGKLADAGKSADFEPVTKERALHDALIVFYESQWPKWKVIYARQDKPSTIRVGCQDHTVFASRGRVFCLELKKKGGKPDADQLAWHKEMEMLGHKVHVIRSMDEFYEVVK